jgi:hypothetical protein
MKVWHHGFLESHKIIIGNYVIYDKESPYYDMVDVLFDLHHKDGTNYNTGPFEIYKIHLRHAVLVDAKLWGYIDKLYVHAGSVLK